MPAGKRLTVLWLGTTVFRNEFRLLRPLPVQYIFSPPSPLLLHSNSFLPERTTKNAPSLKTATYCLAGAYPVQRMYVQLQISDENHFSSLDLPTHTPLAAKALVSGTVVLEIYSAKNPSRSTVGMTIGFHTTPSLQYIRFPL